MAAKGLEQILEKIKTEPRSTLVGRYLMLLADIPDEGAKVGRALDLAESLVESLPDDALRIAHMVHQADRESVRALDVMIACFKARGRLGKSEVLKLERDRIVQEIEARGGPRAASSLSRRALFQLSRQGGGADGSPGGEGRFGLDPMAPAPQDASRIAEIDLGASEVEAVEDQLDFLFPKDGDLPGASPSPAVSVERIRANIDAGMRGGKENRPGDTVFPGGGPRPGALDELEIAPFGAEASPPSAVRPMASQTSVASRDSRNARDAKEGIPAAQAAPAAASSAAAIPRSPSAIIPPAGHVQSPTSQRSQAYVPPPASRRVYAPPSSANANLDLEATGRDYLPSGAAPARDLFDHYWRQGFADEARSILERVAASSSHESWWQARRALVEQAGAGQVLASNSKRDSTTSSGPEGGGSTPLGDEFWRMIQSELGRVARRGFEPPPATRQMENGDHSDGKVGRPRSAAEVRLPKEALKALMTALKDSDSGVVSRAEALAWDLCQGVWGTKPDGACAETLAILGLTRKSPGFWGLYLDALRASGRSRRAMWEIQACVTAGCDLDWARAAWRRLPAIWLALGYRGFPWNEAEGVGTLVARLRERARPRLTALLVGGGSRSA